MDVAQTFRPMPRSVTVQWSIDEALLPGLPRHLHELFFSKLTLHGGKSWRSIQCVLSYFEIEKSLIYIVIFGTKVAFTSTILHMVYPNAEGQKHERPSTTSQDSQQNLLSLEMTNGNSFLFVQTHIIYPLTYPLSLLVPSLSKQVGDHPSHQDKSRRSEFGNVQRFKHSRISDLNPRIQAGTEREDEGHSKVQIG